METMIDDEVDEDCTRTVTRTPIMRPTMGLLRRVDWRKTAPLIWKKKEEKNVH